MGHSFVWACFLYIPVLYRSIDSLTHEDDTPKHKDSLTHHDDTPRHKDSLTHQDSLTHTLIGKAGLLGTNSLGYQSSLSYLTVNCKVKGGLQGVVHLQLASSSGGGLHTADHCQHTHKARTTVHCRSLPTHTQCTHNCTLPITANTHTIHAQL